MARQWWFLIHLDKVLRFRSPSSSQVLKVLSVGRDESEQKNVVVTATNENEIVIETLPVAEFVGSDIQMRVLENMTEGDGFISTLNAIMRGRDLIYFSGDQPLTSSPTKYEYKCPFPFIRQVEVMRSLHPDQNTAGDDQQLDQKSKMWRQACKSALHFKGTATQWGGFFKSAIVVSTMSRRCYRLALAIMQDRVTGHHKVNSFLFNAFCGFRDELLTYTLLRRWESGSMSRKEVEERLIAEKATQRPVAQTNLHEMTSEVRTLKEENRRLRNDNAVLKALLEERDEELKLLKDRVQLLENRETEEKDYEHDVNDRSDVFEFSSEEEERKAESEKTVSQESQAHRKRRPCYAVNYKPASENGSDLLDDSFVDPDWSADDDMVSSSSSGENVADSKLNQAFVFVQKFDPRRVISDEPSMVQGLSPLPAKEQDEEDSTTVSAKEQDSLTTEEVSPEKPEAKRQRRSLKDSMKNVLVKGQKVVGLFRFPPKANRPDEWCNGQVEEVIMSGDMYKILFDDGARRILKKTDVKALRS